MDEIRVTHGRRGKAHKEHFSGAKSKGSSECTSTSKHRTNKVPTGTNSVWCDPLNMPSTSTTPNYSETIHSDVPLKCSSDPACDLSTNLERLSLNTITDSVNGLVNGSLETTNECKNEENSNTSDNKCTVKEPEISSMLPSIKYVQYESEIQMPSIMKIIQKDLSEPYSIYTYRYFIHNWPKLCFLAMCGDECVGAIVCKLDVHRKTVSRGYIAMLAVDQNYRKQSIGSTLVKRAIQEMVLGGADEVVLETEVTNKPALRLYEALGFVRDKRLFRYYLNGVDALRLKLWLR